jgi:hypothetical protein
MEPIFWFFEILAVRLMLSKSVPVPERGVGILKGKLNGDQKLKRTSVIAIRNTLVANARKDLCYRSDRAGVTKRVVFINAAKEVRAYGECLGVRSR